MKAKLINFSTSKTETVDLPDAIFAVDVKPAVLTQAIRVYSANLHQHTHKTLTRGELGRTTAKMYKQKGTGHARHGGKASPTFVGGGVAHGPTGVRPAVSKLNKKVKHLSLLGALTRMAKENKVSLAAALSQAPDKTKTVSNLLNSASINKKTLLIVAKTYPALAKSTGNISFLSTVSADTLNTYLVLNQDHLLIDQDALPVINNLFVDKKPLQAVAVKSSPRSAKPKNASAQKNTPKTSTAKKAGAKKTAANKTTK